MSYIEEAATTEAVDSKSLRSIAISLKRIADAIEGSPSKLGFVEHLSGALSDAIYNAVRK